MFVPFSNDLEFSEDNIPRGTVGGSCDAIEDSPYEGISALSCSSGDFYIQTEIELQSPAQAISVTFWYGNKYPLSSTLYGKSCTHFAAG